MKKSFFLNKDHVKILVTSSCPGVFGFINFIDKKAWLSYSENVTEAIIRNIKLIDSRQHKIKDLETWDVCIFERSKTKQEAKSNFRVYCQNYKAKGLEILNKELKYKIWGEIDKDFRDPNKFLYYVWLGNKTLKQALLGIFDKAEIGEQYLKDFKAGKGTEFPPSSRRLVMEFKGTDFNKKEYESLFKL